MVNGIQGHRKTQEDQQGYTPPVCLPQEMVLQGDQVHFKSMVQPKPRLSVSPLKCRLAGRSINLSIYVSVYLSRQIYQSTNLREKVLSHRHSWCKIKRYEEVLICTYDIRGGSTWHGPLPTCASGFLEYSGWPFRGSWTPAPINPSQVQLMVRKRWKLQSRKIW